MYYSRCDDDRNLFIYILPRNRPATEQRVESDAIVLICKTRFHVIVNDFSFSRDRTLKITFRRMDKEKTNSTRIESNQFNIYKYSR